MSTDSHTSYGAGQAAAAAHKHRRRDAEEGAGGYHKTRAF